jgi:hypothetical protein
MTHGPELLPFLKIPLQTRIIGNAETELCKGSAGEKSKEKKYGDSFVQDD